MRAFLFALVCGRHENGVGKFRIFWDFWELWGWNGVVWARAGVNLSESEKFLDFWDFWKFWGKNEIFWVFWEIWVFWVSKGMEIWTYIILNGKYFQKCIFCFVKSGKYVRRKYFPPTKWDGTTPFGVMGVSVLRVYGLSVATPFHTVSERPL